MEVRRVGRPPTLAASLYGHVQHQRIMEYTDESSRRWSSQELAVLDMYADTMTVSQLLEMLPGRNDLQVRRMLEFLGS